MAWHRDLAGRLIREADASLFLGLAAVYAFGFVAVLVLVFFPLSLLLWAIESFFGYRALWMLDVTMPFLGILLLVWVVALLVTLVGFGWLAMVDSMNKHAQKIRSNPQIDVFRIAAPSLGGFFAASLGTAGIAVALNYLLKSANLETTNHTLLVAFLSASATALIAWKSRRTDT